MVTDLHSKNDQCKENDEVIQLSNYTQKAADWTRTEIRLRTSDTKKVSGFWISLVL